MFFQDDRSVRGIFWGEGSRDEFGLIGESGKYHVNRRPLLEHLVTLTIPAFDFLEHVNEWLRNKLFESCSCFNKSTGCVDGFSSKLSGIKCAEFRETSRCDERVANLSYLANTNRLACRGGSFAVRCDNYFI